MARQHYTPFKNIHSVASTFVASVTADIFDTGIKRLVVRAQLSPSVRDSSQQLATNLVATIPTGSRKSAVTILEIISTIADIHMNC